MEMANIFCELSTSIESTVSSLACCCGAIYMVYHIHPCNAGNSSDRSGDVLL